MDALSQKRAAFGAKAAESTTELTEWLEELLGAEAGVRCYGTSVANPTAQLKNKLGQAGDLPMGLLVLLLRDEGAWEKAHEALSRRWGENEGWAKAVAAVALAHPNEDGLQELRSIVEWKDSPFPKRVRDLLFPDVVVERAERPKSNTSPTEADVEALAARLYLDPEWLRDILWLLEDKKALALYGPPGTGKTFIAREIAKFLQPDPELRRLVQMHPSFGYEEFFEGYRPVPSKEGITLAKVPGPLRQLVRTGLDRADEPSILLIDEMNRANLPRVFGELFFLLEYRQDSVGLMYSPGEEFSLPEHLFILGTMNTADRSVATLDQALRRRFHFYGLFPGEEPVRSMFRRFLEDKHPSMLWLADLLETANALLSDRNMAIGPSHFMRKQLDEDTAKRIWKHSVLPTIRDQFLDDESKADEFAFDLLRETTDEPAT